MNAAENGNAMTKGAGRVTHGTRKIGQQISGMTKRKMLSLRAWLKEMLMK